jgi:hypothetical protein
MFLQKNVREKHGYLDIRHLPLKNQVVELRIICHSISLKTSLLHGELNALDLSVADEVV